MALRPIVVGVDGSPHSEQALVWAVDYATLSGASLRIVCAWELPSDFGDVVTPDPDLYRGLSETFLAQAAERVPDDLAAVTQAVNGHPADVLIGESESAGLLVLGARGHGGFTDMLLGSVTGSCSQHAKCPVVIVRGGIDGKVGP